jgi:hypothetical protein
LFPANEGDAAHEARLELSDFSKDARQLVRSHVIEPPIHS